MGFEFFTNTRIIFGAGTLSRVGVLAKEFGRNVLVVTGRDANRAEGLCALLKEQQLGYVTFSVFGEPEIGTVEQAVALAKSRKSELVISIGGGSALDAGKTIAAMLTNPGTLVEYLEVIGKGKALSNASAPFIAIPTTAGTGSEVTRNAVLASAEHRVKVSLRSPLMLPKIALVDPELTYRLPLSITASTGLDALTQLIEPFVSTRANPMMDALCREGLSRVARSLRVACNNPHEPSAREDMCVASLFGGLALTNAGLGAVHGFAGPIGGMFHAPHGAVCAALLPHVMWINIKTLREREPGAKALARYDEIAQVLTGKPAARMDDGVEWVRELIAELKIPRLSAYGIRGEHTDELVEKSRQASSMKSNPVTLTANELREVLAEEAKPG